MTHIVVEQALLELINGGLGGMRELREADPNQHGTRDMVTLGALGSTLTVL